MYGLNHKAACLIFHCLAILTMKLSFLYHTLEHLHTFSVFKSKKELNYNRFVDPNILGASRLVHSDLRIYRISFFLLDFIFTL